MSGGQPGGDADDGGGRDALDAGDLATGGNDPGAEALPGGRARNGGGPGALDAGDLATDGEVPGAEALPGEPVRRSAVSGALVAGAGATGEGSGAEALPGDAREGGRASGGELPGDAGRGGTPAAGGAAPAAPRWPLTEAQEGLWFAQALDPGNPILNTGQYLDLRGPLDRAAFDAALVDTLAETEALRLRFAATPEGPVQWLDPALPRPGFTDLTHLPEAAALAEALARMQADSARVPDLAAEPPAAFHLFAIGPGRHLWYERIHHLATDGFAMVLFTNRVGERYSARLEGRPLAPPFPPFARALEEDAAYRASDRRAADAGWWRAAMAGLGTVAGPAPGRAVSDRFHHRAARALDAGLMQALTARAAAAGVSWPDALTVLTGAYLARFLPAAADAGAADAGAAQAGVGEAGGGDAEGGGAGAPPRSTPPGATPPDAAPPGAAPRAGGAAAPEVVIGVPFMARLGSRAARVPCMVMNVLPLRLAPDEDAPLDRLLQDGAAALALARRHGRYRSEQLRRDLGRVGGDQRLYGPLVNVQPFDMPPRLAGLEVGLEILGAGAVDDLTFTFRGDARQSLLLEVDANPQLYSADEAAAHRDRLLAFLAAALAAPALAGVPSCSPEELAAIAAANATGHPLPDTTLTALIEAGLSARPQAVAVIDGARQLDYAEFDRLTAALAARLRGLGAGPGRIVAVALERSAALPLALVAILRAGAAYLPLDPGHPPARLSGLIAQARPVALLAEAALDAGPAAGGLPRLAPPDWPGGAAAAPRTGGAAGAGEPTGDPAGAFGMTEEPLGAPGAPVPCEGAPAPAVAAAPGPGGADLRGFGAAAAGAGAPGAAPAPGNPPRQMPLPGGAAPEAEGQGAPAGAGPGDLAYVLFTSGSTGAPKGVMIEHRAIVNRLLWMRDHYGFGPADRILQKTPATFDVSVWEFFLPFLCGGTLVMAPPGAHRDPAALAALIRDHGITTLHFVPSMLAAFLDAPASGTLVQGGAAPGRPALRRVFCSGEALGADHRRRFHARLQGVELHNLYGPTEAAVDVSFWPAGPEDRSDPLPIGLPVWNTRLELLDARLRPLPPGAVGQLYLGGQQLARGYLGRPDLTAARFLPDPARPGEQLYATGDLALRRPDGAVVYLGRADDQVKIRGIRIEPGEIEAALRGGCGLREAVVVAREDRAGDRRLVAYVVPAPGQAAAPEALRAALAARLPAPMVPAAFVVLPALPLSANGKLDRKALPAPVFAGQEGGGPARPGAEARLAALFAEVLGLAAVPGREGDFFLLGGDSLLALRLCLRVEEAFGLDPGLGAVFADPTVAGLAARIEAIAPPPTFAVAVTGEGAAQGGTGRGGTGPGRAGRGGAGQGSGSGPGERPGLRRPPGFAATGGSAPDATAAGAGRERALDAAASSGTPGAAAPVAPVLAAGDQGAPQPALPAGPDHGLGPAILLARGDAAAAPLFIVHPAGGLAWGYRRLAREFAPGRAVWGLQAPALDPAVPLPASLEALAADYAARVAALRPDGVLHLAGWSVGGILAQAMAVALEASGRRVGLLALLDAYPAECWRAEPEPDPVAALRALLAIAGHDPEAHPELDSRAAVVAFLRQGGTALGALPEPVLDGVVRVVTDTNRLVRGHWHRRYGGRLTHVRAALDHAGRGLHAGLWAPHAAALDRIELPVLHPGMISDLAAAQLGPALGWRMVEAEAAAEAEAGAEAAAEVQVEAATAADRAARPHRVD